MALEEKKPDIVLATIIFYCFHIILHKVAVTGNNIIFPTPFANTSKEFWMDISPLDSTYLIMDFVYIFQLLWLLYTLFMLIRRKAVGDILSVEVFFWFGAHVFFMTIWLFMWSRQGTMGSLVLIIMASVSLDMSMYYACVDLHVYLQFNPYPLHKTGIWFQWILVQNALMFAVTWNIFLVVYHFCVFVAYDLESTQEVASYMGLGLMTCLICFNFYMENFKYKNYIRYSFSNYIVLVVIFSGIIGDDIWEGLPMALSDEVVIGLMVLLLILFLARVVILIRHFELDNDYDQEETTHLINV